MGAFTGLLIPSYCMGTRKLVLLSHTSACPVSDQTQEHALATAILPSAQTCVLSTSSRQAASTSPPPTKRTFPACIFLKRSFLAQPNLHPAPSSWRPLKKVIYSFANAGKRMEWELGEPIQQSTTLQQGWSDPFKS